MAKGVHEKRLTIVVDGERYFFDVYLQNGGGRLVNVRPAGDLPPWDSKRNKYTWVNKRYNVCEFYHQKNGDLRRRRPKDEKWSNRKLVFDKKFLDAYQERLDKLAEKKTKLKAYW